MAFRSSSFAMVKKPINLNGEEVGFMEIKDVSSEDEHLSAMLGIIDIPGLKNLINFRIFLSWRAKYCIVIGCMVYSS